jgi:macrolide-specific efflux system membrane fusion protein
MKKRYGFFAGALLLSGAGAYYAITGQKPSITYDKIQVVRSEVHLSVTATGGVKAQNRLEIKPPLAGRIESILVEEGEKVRKGKVLAWMSSTERVALVDTASARGEAERKKWEQMYRPTPIIAPLDGLLILRNVEPGQTVTASDIVLVMSDHLIVRADVDETDIGRIEVGQEAKVVLDAYPKEKIFGKVDHIAFDAKTENNVTVYAIDILPEKVPGFMRSGMTATVNFNIEKKENVLVVPQEAIQTKEGATFVWGPETSKSTEPKLIAVTTGLSDGRHVEILSGLAEGDFVWIQKNPSGNASKGSNPFAPFSNRRGNGKPR